MSTRSSWRSRRCKQSVSVGVSDEDGAGVGDEVLVVAASAPPLPSLPSADNANATTSTAAIPITAIVASRARVGGPDAASGAGGAAACRGRTGVGWAGATSGPSVAPRSTIDALPFSWPHSGQVHAVVPGRMWNRTPQLAQLANTHTSPQDTQV